MDVKNQAVRSKASFFGSLGDKRGLGLALTAAFILRGIWILLVPSLPLSDQHIYYVGAVHLASGRGFSFDNGDPNGFWPVGYSAFLSLFFRIFGPRLVVACLANLFLGVLLVFLVFLLGRRLYGRNVGLAGAWVTALYPGLVMYSTVVASENLYLPLLVAGVLCMATAVGPRGRGERRRHGGEEVRRFMAAALGGVILGLAALVRPTAFAMPFLLLAAGFLYKAGWFSAAAKTVVAAALMVAVCLPWGLRNKRVFGEFNLSSFNSGAVLWMGNHDGDPEQKIPERFLELDLVARDRAMRKEALDYIKAHPGLYAVRCLTRTITALRSETIPVAWNRKGITRRFGKAALGPLKLFCSLGWWVLLGFSAWALGFGLWRKRVFREDLLLIITMALCSAPFIFFDSQNRYHLPLVPFLVILAVSLARRKEDFSAQARGES